MIALTIAKIITDITPNIPSPKMIPFPIHIRFTNDFSPHKLNLTVYMPFSTPYKYFIDRLFVLMLKMALNGLSTKTPPYKTQNRTPKIKRENHTFEIEEK